MPSYIQDYFERSATLRSLDIEGRAELVRRAPQSLIVAIAEAFNILDAQRKARYATI
jgi:hypothetical protein